MISGTSTEDALSVIPAMFVKMVGVPVNAVVGNGRRFSVEGDVSVVVGSTDVVGVVLVVDLFVS